ncbi:MAG: ComF family protein [Rhodobacteraceae bacterium]|nr:ComF family protein [Paracoccaceae bacterium]
MQSVLRVLYLPHCLTCAAQVTTEFGLCGACWAATPFVTGVVCDICGTPLPGTDDGTPVHCDDCLTIARPWDQGRAALVYKDNGRKLVLALKHGDRLDLVRPMAGWMHRAVAPILRPGMLVVPVPLHWRRLLRRRYNQAALLSQAVAKAAGLDHCPDLLIRTRRTPTQEGRDRDSRFANISGALAIHPRRGGRLPGRHVLLVDDVMTSGATLAAAAEVCRAGGAAQVSVLVLARVAKDA